MTWLPLVLTAISVATSSTAPAPATDPAPTVTLDPFGPKGLRFATADNAYSAKLGVLLQPWWQYTIVEGTDVDTFRIRRLEFGMEGTFLAPNVRYKFKGGFDLFNRPGGVSARLLDAIVDWQIIDELGIQIGQWKVDYTYETIASPGTLLLVDRSLADNYFTLDRDIGVSLHGSLFSKFLDYYAYAMNGDGPNNYNKNVSLFVGWRFVANILGRANYQQSDVANSDSPNLSLGVALVYDHSNANYAFAELVRLTADLAFLYRGFAFLGVGHAVFNLDSDRRDFGFTAQAGYCIIPTRFEVAVRGSGILRDAPPALGGGVDTYEANVGLNYYFIGHGLKVDADYGFIFNALGIEDRKDHQFRVQAQVFF